MQEIILLRNAREIIKADSLCQLNSLKITIIATPSHLTSECGMAIRIEKPEQRDSIINTLIINKLHPQIYEI